MLDGCGYSSRSSPSFCMKNNLLWSVQHPETYKVSYWFGTMHLCPESIFEQKLNHITSYLNTTSAIAVEFDISQDISFDDIAYLPDGKKLTDFIPKKTYSKIRKQLLRFYKVDLDLHHHLRPSFLSNIIPQKMIGEPVQMEKAIIEHTLDKPVHGLEKYEEYVNIFEHISIEQEFRQLKAQVDNLNAAKRKFHRLISAYNNENVNTLYKMTKSGLGKYKRILLDDRNQRMAEASDKLMRDNSVFVCVGAAHLSGNRGCLALLKRFGYLVNPVPVRSNH